MKRRAAPSGAGKDAGETTVGEDTRKLTKSEAGFQEDVGIPELRCGDCAFYEEGQCAIVEGPVGADDYCDQFQPAIDRGNMSAKIGMAMARDESLSSFDMYINRVSEDRQSGERRWFATASGVKMDSYEERMSVDLFKDFIRRIEDHEVPPEPFISKAWKGGLPYLSVAHYLDLEGFGIAGHATQVYIDGDVFKAKGVFEDADMGRAAYDAVKRDIDQEVPDDERIRISIAFIDYGHEHEGMGHFERRSLDEVCDMCVKAIKGKIYRMGQLVHLAMTRRPAYIETEIALEERSLMKTRQDDASSIVGDELAEELEKRQRKLTERSSDGIAEGAIVIKDDQAEESAEGEPMHSGSASAGEESGPGEGAMAKSTFLNGAVTLDEAEKALAERSDGAVYLDDWGVLRAVLSNIAPDKAEAIGAVLEDFQNRVDIMAVKAVTRIGALIEDESQPSSEPSESAGVVSREDNRMEEHALRPALTHFQEAFDEAVATPVDRQSRLAMIQPALNELGEAVLRAMDDEPSVNPAAPAAPAGGGITADQIRQIVGEAVQPLSDKIAQMEASGAVARNAPREPMTPARRALRMPVGNADSVQPSVKPGSIKAIVRRSVGL